MEDVLTENGYQFKQKEVIMELKNISKHRPEGLIIDVAEDDVKAILKTGEFIESTKENLIVEKKIVDINKPNESWTEKKIDEWIENNAPDIKYYPSKHTKKYILDKLRDSKII